MQTKELSIFIADEYTLIREGIKKIIKPIFGASIVGETNNMNDLAFKIKNCLPDLIIMEISMCERPIKQLLKEIRNASPSSKILIVSDCECSLPVMTSIREGVSGFVKKNVTEEELIKAIICISNGEDFYTPDIAHMPASENLTASTTIFSIRELEILRYICKGRSNEQIADILFISEKTVATHKKNIMRKAGVKKAIDLVVWALDNKMIR
jgi:DNA-binding NarL/FixJ family response regulator